MLIKVPGEKIAHVSEKQPIVPVLTPLSRADLDIRPARPHAQFMKNITRFVLPLYLALQAACFSPDVPDYADPVEPEVQEQELLLSPITLEQGSCSPHSGTWCTSNTHPFEGAYYANSSTFTNTRLNWWNYGPLSGSPADSGMVCVIARRKNDCNYVRACRIPSSDTFSNPNTTGAYTISVKNNPGLAQASQCPGAQGMQLLRFGSMAKLVYSNQPGFQHSIEIIWPPSGSSLLQVKYDGYSTPFTTTLPTGVNAWTGPASVYTERNIYDLQVDGN